MSFFLRKVPEVIKALGSVTLRSAPHCCSLVREVIFLCSSPNVTLCNLTFGVTVCVCCAHVYVDASNTELVPTCYVITWDSSQ